MKFTHGLACGTLILCSILLSSLTFAQNAAGHSFPGTLSFDSYYGGMFDWYHGYSMGVRVAVPLFKFPTFNPLLSVDGEDTDDLLVLPGIKIGIVNGANLPIRTEAMYFAPDLSLHYSLLRTYSVTLFTGPSAEFIYTDNWNKYKLIPSAGIDLGVMYRLSPHFSIAAEFRRIFHESATAGLNNIANFPLNPFSEIGLVLRIALPWKAEENGYAKAASEYEHYHADASSAQHQLQKTTVHADSLEVELASLKTMNERGRKTEEAAASLNQRPRVDQYNPDKVVSEPNYTFTKDPFMAGNLVDDQYLKNVLIDILDDEYVWQLSAAKSRLNDAEKIRAYFILYNSALGKRIIVAEDAKVDLFKLTCLGKAAGIGSRKGR